MLTESSVDLVCLENELELGQRVEESGAIGDQHNLVILVQWFV